MREQCNIFIRQEQAPLAKNEFVRLLDRPCCTDSTQAELDSAISEQEKKRKSAHCSKHSPVDAPGTESTKVLTISEMM